MKIRSAIVFSALAILPFCAFSAQEGEIMVQRLNIRVKPSGNSTVVGSFSKGDKISVQEVKSGWCRIALPKDSAVWVASKFIKDGKIVKSVNLRSGPGLNYGSFGIVEAGQQVNVIDNKNKDWVKIEPLASISGWVAAQYVKLDKGAGASAGPANNPGMDPTEHEILSGIEGTTPSLPDKPSTDVKPPVDSGTKVTDPVVPDDKNKVQPPQGPVPLVLPEEDTTAKESELTFVDEPAEDVTYEGVIAALNPGAAVVTHALGTFDRGQYKPDCYLYGHESELSKYVGIKIAITGKKRNVKGWGIPVVKVTGIAVYNN